MTTALLDLIHDALSDLKGRSWHETTRRDLGLTDETDGEALLALTITKTKRKNGRPLAFVIEGDQVENTLVALSEYLGELFKPGTGADGAIAVIDFLPPLDEQGQSRGATRRWVMDITNSRLMMTELGLFMRLIARGL